MGSCASSPVKTIKPRKPRRLRSRKTKKHDKLKKKNSDAGDSADTATDQNVDTTATTTTTCRESYESTHNPTLTELQSTQIDTNSTVDEPWFDSVSSIEDSESDDDFTSVDGGNVFNFFLSIIVQSSYYLFEPSYLVFHCKLTIVLTKIENEH